MPSIVLLPLLLLSPNVENEEGGVDSAKSQWDCISPWPGLSS